MWLGAYEKAEDAALAYDRAAFKSVAPKPSSISLTSSLARVSQSRLGCRRSVDCWRLHRRRLLLRWMAAHPKPKSRGDVGSAAQAESKVGVLVKVFEMDPPTMLSDHRMSDCNMVLSSSAPQTCVCGTTYFDYQSLLN
ncbi:AP2/ERF domain containing protein [Trema orientale]|uniref:AP2/ERF domain containing protein n=1 Tax=Trema orientale TaxID=63057 RepID=A0A2P5DA71_TREOI|nr:AP2/ERF domain containing protein [Trema orientale]